MEVFRIALAKYTIELFASGNENRWNYKGQKVIYTAGSRALACLENVVHSSGEGLQQEFKIMVIYVPDSIFIESVNRDNLNKDWYKYSRPLECQNIGSQWYDNKGSVFLKVPSAIVQNEYNYIINTDHADFKKIRIIGRENFLFDSRIKSDVV